MNFLPLLELRQQSSPHAGLPGQGKEEDRKGSLGKIAEDGDFLSIYDAGPGPVWGRRVGRPRQSLIWNLALVLGRRGLWSKVHAPRSSGLPQGPGV